MKIFRKFKCLYKEKFTFIIVPHNGKNTKQFKLNKLLIYSSLTLITSASIFFITATFYLFNENTLLVETLQIKNDEINNLNIITDQQKAEIEELKNTSKMVMDKLSQLYALENKVRNMVGLKNVAKENNLLKVSRSFDRTNSYIDGSGFYSDLTNDKSVDEITNLIDLQKDNYDNFIKELEKQLKYLECRPDKWPVSGRITSKFAYRIHPISGKRQFHDGLDIANDSGTKIVAAGSGIVTYSGWNGGYGRVIIISHGYGYKSVYAHNRKNLVAVGERVKKGQVIAELGNTGRSTGPHLHFEVYYKGNKIDPLKILKSK
jgi:murein DD-endopeptidase MepM/ murein hydrolase activator NlpD